MTTCFACNTKEESVVNYAIITGKVTNAQGKINIYSPDGVISKLVVLAEDGSFTDTLKTGLNTYSLFDGNRPVTSLYVKPGSTLNLSYDGKTGKVVLTGSASKENSYIRERKRKKFIDDATGWYELDETEFNVKNKAYKTARLAFLESHKELPEDFIALEKKDITYGYLSSLHSYETVHALKTKNKDFKVSDGFLDELKDFDHNDPNAYSYSWAYRYVVKDRIKNQVKDMVATDSINQYIAYLKIASAVESETIKNDLLFQYAYKRIGYTNDIDTFYKVFKENSTDVANNELIADKYDKLTKLSKGRPSPKFHDYENHAGGTMSLDDLKEKYVYIDVWATWCGPCKKEIPFLKEVEKKYHGKNIAFVSLSIDKEKDHEKWRNMVTEKELGGIQLFADKDWESQFVKDYEIQGIPRFILIDPSGNIVDFKAPRPSSPELIDLFNELNI